MAATLLKVKDVAERLNCSVGNVYALVASRRLKSIRIGATAGIRISETALAEFLSEGEQTIHVAITAEPRASGGTPFKQLDGERLLESWRQQGVAVPQRGAGNARSSS